MIRVIYGIFMIMHGLIHMLYFGQSARYFELTPGIAWPDGAWAFSKFMANDTIRTLANVLLVMAAVAFAVGGVGVLAKQDWWPLAVGGAAVFSAMVYILLWDGVLTKMPDKGWIGILIDLAILIALFIFHWPNLD